jgi:hypothetical protein
VWGSLGCVGLILGYLQSQHVFSLGRFQCLFRCVLESFNPFGGLDGLGCGLFCSVGSICSSRLLLCSFVEASLNDIPLESCMHARTHARTHTRQEFQSTLHATCVCVRCSAKPRGAYETHPLCATLHAMFETRDMTQESAGQRRWNSWRKAFAVAGTMRSSSLLISCILHAAACSSNRCAVQMIDPRSPLPAHPRAAPGKEKCWWVSGVNLSWRLSRNRVHVDPEVCVAWLFLICP